MKQIKMIATFALLCVIIIGSMAGCSGNTTLTVEDAEKRDDIIIASLDGVNVSLSDYVYWYRMNQMQMEQEAIGNGYTTANLADYWNEIGEDGKTNAQIIRDISLIDAKHFASLLNLANEAGMALNEDIEAENNSLIDEAVTALDEDPAKAELAFLKKYGSTSNQMKRMYTGMDIIDIYIAGLEENLELSENELKAEYEANQADYEMVTVRHVLVLCSEGMTDKEKEEAKEKADDIFRQLNEGADIAELAKEYSEDPGSVDNNGEYTFGRGQMVTEFEDWAFAASEGDTGIVQTDYGYHIMQSMAKPDFDAAADTIRQKLAYDKINEIVEGSYNKAEQPWDENDKEISGINTEIKMIEDASSQG